MPMPLEYREAQSAFRDFLETAQSELNSPSHNATYTTVQSVFHVFRRRLNMEDNIRFAQVLPALLRSIYTSDWKPQEPVPFLSLSDMNAEVKSLRAAHNFSPDNAIKAVAIALRRHVDESKLDASLETLTSEARDFWNSE